ncbi:MAG: polyphosphate kinase 2 family protein [Vicinamibacterales bacterium]
MHTRDFIVPPGRPVRLGQMPTDNTPGVKGKAEAPDLLAASIAALAEQQEKLYVQDRWSLLIILQALDAAGKDSTIKHVMSGVNPQGVQVTSFKAPSTLELDHDYLWRSVIALPARGTIGIHNRSYYEEVLVARVHPEILARQQLPDRGSRADLWSQRYRQINDFERFLVENGTRVLKFFLHVSKDEQAKRLLKRIDDPDRQWKFSVRDVQERARWDDYARAYEDMLAATSTKLAPWFVIPADRKWYMQLAVGEIIVKALQDLDLRFPPVDDTRRRELAEGRRLLSAETKPSQKGRTSRPKGQR